MTVKVKICGIRTAEALDAALGAGADYIGLVFHGPSPRNLSPREARALADRARGRADAVAVLVDPDDDRVTGIAAAVAPAMLQLHGAETPERVAEIRALAGLPVIKAVHVETAADAERASAYAAADMILYDAKPPAGAALPGGNGVPFDWRALTGVKRDARFMLSGGLTPDNVAAALAVTEAPMVDVSSGVERAPGDKDPDLIRRFVAAAKGARPAAA